MMTLLSLTTEVLSTCLLILPRSTGRSRFVLTWEHLLFCQTIPKTTSTQKHLVEQVLFHLQDSEATSMIGESVKAGTMFYNVEVPGAMILVGDTHAAQGDSELAGTAMETSMTTKLRVTLHKAGSLPKKVESMPFPLLETDTQYVVHGFAYANYLDDLENPSDIFSEGAALDLAMTDCFVKTRDWLMDVFDLIEEETIALMTTAVDFGITQVVDGNWGVHADISKWVFEEGDTPFDYSCTPSKGPGRARRARMLEKQDRRHLLEMHGVEISPEDYASNLYSRVTKDCETCHSSGARELLANKLLDAKLNFAKKLVSHEENLPKL